MPQYRFYINREITDKGGGDHIRYEDIEADDQEAAASEIKLESHEEIGDVVELRPELNQP